MRRSRTSLSFLRIERVREPLDSGPAPASPHGGGGIRRRFSGSPLLPLLCSHPGPPGEMGPSARVVFTIGARGTESSPGPAAGR
ncbi:cAMP-specific 3',5'-cyclic phosphodiesterase 4C-like [Heterocephalus glaber]|uniref:cAMP-specific 3',5'-cyclic phosphodiesterase 4C-like n=1 Tax=Heterocephalus glaber TaxID=10181 RepID=A0AAX6S9H2_HETGA|nr:cAMP-specific 3',5'-cyclic phosphodiesterase 4C-like [Heterocephalus glaber]